MSVDQGHIRDNDVGRATWAMLQASLMCACMLEDSVWGGAMVGAPHIADDLKAEIEGRQAKARQLRRLRRQARTAKRAAARLDLPEQIW